MKLSNIENSLIGQWIYKGGSICKDETTEQIEWLINNQLKKIATDESGWDVLYIDPDDNRFWELVYSESEMQGGGPPSLIHISNENAKKKYSI